jgi:hypothetical protein
MTTIKASKHTGQRASNPYAIQKHQAVWPGIRWKIHVVGSLHMSGEANLSKLHMGASLP